MTDGREQTDRQMDICTFRVAFATEKDLFHIFTFSSLLLGCHMFFTFLKQEQKPIFFPYSYNLFNHSYNLTCESIRPLISQTHQNQLYQIYLSLSEN